MSYRIEKVNELLRLETSKAITRVVKPEWGIVTVVRVETQKDLRRSVVWVSIFGSEPKESFELLKKSTKEIQSLVNPRLSMKFTPVLDFRLDTSGEYVELIEKKLREAKEEE